MTSIAHPDPVAEFLARGGRVTHCDPNGMAGDKIVNLSIATSETWKDKHSGERKEKTEWHRVVIFNPNLADIAERFLKKGSPVYIEGALQTRKWTDQQGVERYSTEVVIGRFKGELTLLGGGNGQGGPRDERDGYGTQRQREPAGGSTFGGMDASGRSTGGGGGGGWEPPADLDDEIPFLWPGDMPLGRKVP